MEIRTATEADIADIQSIYAHHVLTGTGTFEEEPPSVEDEGWKRDLRGGRVPRSRDSLRRWVGANSAR